MSHESIDDLYARWQRDPSAAATAALCEALRGGSRADLIEIVGRYASRQPDVRALVAAARMYLDAHRLDEAQGALLAAGRLAPRDGAIYRWLGEVLLRRGDTERAEKVLAKALELGVDDGARALLDQSRDAPRAPPERREAAGHVAADELGEDIETQVRKDDDVKAAIEAALSPIFATIGAAERRPPSTERRPPAAPYLGGGPPRAHDLIFTTPARDLGFDLQPEPQTRDNALGARGPVEAPAATAAFGAAVPTAAPPLAPPSAGSRRAPEPPIASAPRAPAPAPAPRTGGAPIPEARDVLDALQIAGVYEPSGATAPKAYAWAKPEKSRRRFGVVTLIGLAVALVGAGIGTFYEVTDRRAKQHLEAEELLATIEGDLEAADANLLDSAERSIARAFELDSRSPRAALTWLRERALVGLLKGGDDLAFEDGIRRAKAVGVDDEAVAFARVASFFFQGDTAGAAATIDKWDAVAQGDAWFQLLAGATFERAGDPRAIDRYAAAVRLAPELVIAHVHLARAAALDGDRRRAAALAAELRARRPERAEGVMLAALASCREPVRGDAPPEVTDALGNDAELPVSLRAVPHAARAIVALERGDDAKPHLQRGLDVVDTPGVAAWLGGIALDAGDEELARRAALIAVSYSAVYAPARALAARVALLGGRLDEALEAVEDLPMTSPDVAIVTAAVAYETLDIELLSRALDAAPAEPRAGALARGRALLGGDLGALSRDDARAMGGGAAPWAALVAMDWALDAGDLALARAIAGAWRGAARAPRAARLARLARYDGRLEDADALSRVAIETGTVTVRALMERVFTLVASTRDDEALALLERHPEVGGPLATWLRAFATASPRRGKIDEARALVAQRAPPSSDAPMPARILAASAYARMKDKRRGAAYTRGIVMAGFASPDVAFAASGVGLGKVVHRPRR